MSKGERNRIKIRVRSAMAAQAANDGRFLGGRPPYGYRIADAGPHPNPSKNATGARLHRLEPDPVTAPVVARIFADFLAGKGLREIADRLHRSGIPCHPPMTPRVTGTEPALGTLGGARNPRQPRYTGYQVWNRQCKDEVLLDVDDVGLGHQTKMRSNTEADWIWSNEPAHPALIDRAASDGIVGPGSTTPPAPGSELP